MTKAATVSRWMHEYARETGAPVKYFRDFGDDIALAMRHLVEGGRSPKSAYDLVASGLYGTQVVEASLASNRGRRKRTSRRER